MIREEDFKAASVQLNVQVAHIKAICEVEAPKGGFLLSGRLTILYERHKFSHFTKHKFDMAFPDISNTASGGYADSEGEWTRYEKAAKLDAEAAKKSVSWGRFQIMGFNATVAGYPTVDAMIEDFKRGEDRQLAGFVNFLLSDSIPVAALRKNDFSRFSRWYNGPKYRLYHYDKKLATAYYKYGGRVGGKTLSEVLKGMGY